MISLFVSLGLGIILNVVFSRPLNRTESMRTRIKTLKKAEQNDSVVF